VENSQRILDELLRAEPTKEIAYIMETVQQIDPDAHLRFDPTLIRGMGYYTGAIFEIKLHGVGGDDSGTAGADTPRAPQISIAGGGRYDKMIGKWTGKAVPAAGFSIGFERIIGLLEMPPSQTPKLAILYKTAADSPKIPVPILSDFELLKLQQEYQAQGFYVTPWRVFGKLTSTFFDTLVAQGFTHTLTNNKLKELTVKW
jgi:histidyl-tRNA synthetase